MLLSSVAAAVTGVSVGAGLLGKDAGAGTADLSSSLVAEGSPLSGSSSATAPTREAVVSRGDARPAVDPAKLGTAVDDQPSAVTGTRTLSQSDPKDVARALLSDYGFSIGQFGCLESLWNRESGWRTTAANPSGAYGIPQALPGSKMSSAGPDWQHNAETQIRWGLGYIRDRYGSPCGAWGHSESHGWY
ncbi:aggregation-promoting factor C-terminal-like domain-containing protein [Nocardioides montaniterrae]